MPQAPFYQSTKWRSTRASFLHLHPDCFVCAMLGFSRRATEVDHKRSLALGGAPFDHKNLQGMCKPHHSQKTALGDQPGRASRAIATTGLDGYPVHIEKPRTQIAKPKKY